MARSDIFMDGAGRRRRKELWHDTTAAIDRLEAFFSPPPAPWTDKDEETLKDRMALRNELYQQRLDDIAAFTRFLYTCKVEEDSEPLSGLELANAIEQMAAELADTIIREHSTREACSALIEAKHRAQGIPATTTE